jgi:hypothetical protein
MEVTSFPLVQEELATQNTIKEQNMRKLRLIMLVAALTLIPSGNLRADDGSACNPIPGQTNTPPCALAQRVSDDDMVSDPTSAVAPSNAPSEYSITELTLDVVENLLALF